MSDTNSVLRVSKLDAARRQLRTAITLWFTDGDPVAVHALAFAAYEIYHFVSKKRDPYRRDLLLDSDWVKDEFRQDWEKLLKKEVNFFKHADRDPDDIMEFNTSLSESFILYAIIARQICGEGQTQEESDFMWWFHINRPEQLTDKGTQDDRSSLASRDYQLHSETLEESVPRIALPRSDRERWGPC